MMARSGRKRYLSEEDLRLWTSVARTVRPIGPRSRLLAEEPEERQEMPEAWPVPPAIPAMEAPRQQKQKPAAPPRPAGIDRPTKRKISRGRIELEGTIDLHDMTQSRAYDALLGFLRQAHTVGRRHVLVITGKGTSSGSGVLRNAVPHWLATQPFLPLVSSFDSAGRTHGGEGAIYVKLRRRERT